MSEGLHRIAAGLLVAGCCIAGGVAVLGQGARRTAQMAVRVLSSRPDMVTGGDALSAISPAVPATAKLTVNVNGKPVAASFKPLQKIFSTGVCDWSKPGIGTVPLKGTWQRY